MATEKKLDRETVYSNVLKTLPDKIAFAIESIKDFKTFIWMKTVDTSTASLMQESSRTLK